MSDCCDNRHVILRDLNNYLKKGTVFDGYTEEQKKQINENLGISDEIDTKTASSAVVITATLEEKMAEMKEAIQKEIDAIVAAATNHIKYIGTYSNCYDIIWVKAGESFTISDKLSEGEKFDSFECSDGSLVLSGDDIITGVSKGLGYLKVSTQDLKDNYDVNKDGVINTTDITSIHNYIINGSESGITKENADVNADEYINARDVVDEYNYIINGGFKNYLVLCEPETSGLYVLTYKVESTYFTLEYLFNGSKFIELGNEGINSIQNQVEGDLVDRTDTNATNISINTETISTKTVSIDQSIATKTSSLEEKIKEKGGDIEWNENN